jgi:hypothetical protein
VLVTVLVRVWVVVERLVVVWVVVVVLVAVVVDVVVEVLVLPLVEVVAAGAGLAVSAFATKAKHTSTASAGRRGIVKRVWLSMW